MMTDPNKNDDMERRIEACARAAHEVNRAYCKAIDDDAQLPWEEAPEWQRQSAIKGALAAVMDAGTGDGTTARETHERWMAEKVKEGWTRGPVKDPEKKTHPCIMQYDHLPPEQRAKDTIFLAVVKGVFERRTN